MRNKVQDVASYHFQAEDRLLLDANIWLYLYPPPAQPAPGYSAPYTAAVKNMMAAKAQILLDALVLSEYVNRYFRIEWSARYNKTYRDFKDFRKSADFAAVGADVASYVRMILKHGKRCDQPFESANIEEVVSNVETGAIDFNDGLIAENCRLNGWKLVTNDQDFKDGGIEVLTANPRLRAACP